MTATDRPSNRPFRVETIDYATGVDDLRAVREPVFVQEQQVPLALEWDELDPLCVHVIARDAAGAPIGTGRLTPEHKIGRMAVLPDWRGRGVGDGLLLALIAEAERRHWPELHLHAQVSAVGFYVKHGFVPVGDRFMEAGIEHQTMRRQLGGPTAIDTRDAAVAIACAVIAGTRRELSIYSRALDPGLFDAPEVLDALRRLGTRRQRVDVRILLQDADAPQRAHAPLIALAQRLPSVFGFREANDPADRGYASAFIVNDGSGYYFRTLGNRFDGEGAVDAGGRARQLADTFQPVWERSRIVTEYRVLGV
ncbi:GNAT family N-acetyltransferase [Lysobacter hankyongensis]|uniref:GNAT family N-acetyltransferase n=1 Tax=Lysobacter hankyongensis TaxID=1176535 RepID=A0ABP9BRP4_9GAMM